MKKFFFLLILGSGLIYLTSCQGSISPPRKNPKKSLTSSYIEGLTFLSSFDPSRAETEFQNAIHENPDDCKSYVGLVLADVQYVVFKLNGQISGLTSSIGGSSPAYKTEANGDAGEFQGYDLNKLVFGILQSFDPYIQEMDNAANKVEELSAKNGWEACVLDTREANLSGSEEQFFPLRIGGNKKNAGEGIYPPVEIRLGPLFDEAEVRFFTSMFTLLEGIMYFVVSHDLTMTLDLTRIGRALSPLSETIAKFGDISSLIGVNLGACTISYSDGSQITFNSGYIGFVTSPVNHERFPVPFFPPNDSYPENSRLLTFLNPNNCAEAYTLGSEGSISSIYSVLRKFSFILNNNPAFLGKSKDRWDRYFPRVDNVLGESFTQISGLFDALINRSISIVKSGKYTVDDLDNFFVYVKEQDPEHPDKTLGDGDMIGFSFGKDPSKRIDVHLFKDDSKNSSIKDVLTTIVIPMLKRNTSDEEIKGFQKLFTDLRDNFLAVDKPNIKYKPFKISDLNVLLSATDILIGALPDAIEFDIPKYFINPHPLRDYMPYWYRYQDPSFIFAHDFPTEFLIETEWTTSLNTKGNPGTPDMGSFSILKMKGLKKLFTEYARNLYQVSSDIHYPTTETEGIRRKKYEFLINSKYPLKAFLINDSKLGYNFKDYDFIGDVPHFTGNYNIAGPVSRTPEEIPSDCFSQGKIKPINIKVGGFNATFPPEVIAYFAFPDPSLNGMLLINLDAFSELYPTIKCANDPSGYQVATNYSLNKSVYMTIYVILDKVGLQSVLNLVGGGG